MSILQELSPRKERKTHHPDPGGDYLLLRGVLSFMMVLGVVIIVGGLLYSVGMFYYVRETAAELFSSDGGPKYTNLTNELGFYAAIVSVISSSSAGLLMIASSQVIKVFLDIRDDTRRILHTLEE